MTTEQIYRSDNLHIFSEGVTTDLEAPVIVSFTNWRPKPTLAFGASQEVYFRSKGRAAFHVHCKGNDWWLYPDMFDALSALKEKLQGRSRIASYGSSMGGYASLRFAKLLGVQRATASCPQYSINQAVVPSETRWRDEASVIDFTLEKEFEPSGGTQYAVLYDPLFKPDRKQVEAYSRLVDIETYKVPVAGHPPQALLEQYGIVSSVTMAMIDGDLDPAFIVKTHRDARREIARYWMSLSARLIEHGKLEAFEIACEKFRSLSRDKDEADTWILQRRRMFKLT